ncbi:PDZ domain-containing protein [Cohnella sp. CFH 77786]|uniref:S1C family serine protease n=1 Tax=Cohnella sp. CFH 77786 TaxID=2662265 RepID=UPI001C60E6D7|nr:trypsin-like peptidase domain-containing protein [Cohnella sp. CFH 77786]MBW5448751.1 PDZ domain-containing protein [Cohnella sp. CFH 77786]
MSLFDDDFYSTKTRRGTKRYGQAGFGGGRGFRSMSTLRVAVASSLVSALAVVLLFMLIVGNREESPAARPAMAGGQSLVETSERIITASEKIRPTVVSIINITREAKDHASEKDGGSAHDNEVPENASLGSGVIFEKKDGKAFIITNAHVVTDAAEVQAVLMDGTKKEARIVGQDTISDLAVLSVDAKGIDKVAEIGESDKLRVGEMVIAVGNPLGFGDSVTNGIVSFLHRIVPVSLNQDGIYDWEQEVIQTTAAINQGNSGGVLADLNGSVIGINSMKIADTGVEGIGFAIPIDAVMPVVEQLMKNGKVLRPYMGVFSMDLSVYLDNPVGSGSDDSAKDSESGTDSGHGEDGSKGGPVVPEGVKDGALVLEAVGPAKEAGLRLNDIITELDGKPIKGTLDLRKYLYNEKKIGDSLTVTYYRDGKKEELKLTLTEKDKEE